MTGLLFVNLFLVAKSIAPRIPALAIANKIMFSSWVRGRPFSANPSHAVLIATFEQLKDNGLIIALYS